MDTANDGSLSIILFSGTDDKLSSTAILAVGAAAMGRAVRILLQYWALRAFRADDVYRDHGAAPEAGADVARVRDANQPGSGRHWADLFAQAKTLGDVSITACAHSMEVFEIDQKDLDPLVDGVQGIAGFMGGVDGPLVFV